MPGLVRNYLLPGAATRRERERFEARRREEALAAERARRRDREWIEHTLAVEEQAAARPRRSAVRVVRAALWRGRAALRPVYALGVLYAAGAAVRTGGPSPAPAVLVLAVVAVGGWRVRLARLLDRRVERVYGGACLFGAWLWLCSCVVASPVGREWQLLYPWVVAAIVWWWPGRHWPSDWRPQAEIVVEDDDSLRARWETNLAAPGGRLAGSRVLDVTRDEHGAEVMLVKLVPGQHTVETATLAADHIASGLEEPDEQLIVERAPVETNPKRNPTLVQVKVLPESPINKIMWFDRPLFTDGRVLLGKHTDQVGHAAWTIYDKRAGRMRGGNLFGGTGVGKSSMIDNIVVTVLSPEWQALYPTMVIYLDGQAGASSPLLWKSAALAAGPDEAPEVLAGLLRVGAKRQRWNTFHDRTDGFHPGQSPGLNESGQPIPGLPGILVIVDEEHGIFTREHAPGWSTVAREFGKVGVAVLGAGQVTSLEAFGDNDALRGSMLSGNGIAMNIQSRTAGNLIPGLHVDPHKLPKVPGYAVKLSVPGSDDRAAPFQGRYLPDRQAVEKGIVVPDGVRLLEDWYAAATGTELDEMSARAFGPVYLERDARKARQREELAAELEGRPVASDAARSATDCPADSIEADDDAVATATAKVYPMAAARMSRAEKVALGRRALGLPPLPEATEAAAEFGDQVRARFAAPQPEQTAAEKPSTRDVIRDYLREHGQASRKDIFAHVAATAGTSQSAAKQALQLLVERQEVAREGGVYVWLNAA